MRHSPVKPTLLSRRSTPDALVRAPEITETETSSTKKHKIISSSTTVVCLPQHIQEKRVYFQPQGGGITEARSINGARNINRLQQCPPRHMQEERVKLYSASSGRHHRGKLDRLSPKYMYHLQQCPLPHIQEQRLQFYATRAAPQVPVTKSRPIN